ncbi:CLUMA_CG002461, isoform A [Clunio marinus]|uniref:CLUMA_CG002461, isoform A n=1 Tax=Clunio marinus TaxID=568069 RepID=A0A1J1HQ66_9DIPT|nr:CLUMA_CG002461, isoform A [Clunio marinus]
MMNTNHKKKIKEGKLRHQMWAKCEQSLEEQIAIGVKNSQAMLSVDGKSFALICYRSAISRISFIC